MNGWRWISTRRRRANSPFCLILGCMRRVFSIGIVPLVRLFLNRRVRSSLAVAALACRARLTAACAVSAGVRGFRNGRFGNHCSARRRRVARDDRRPAGRRHIYDLDRRVRAACSRTWPLPVEGRARRLRDCLARADDRSGDLPAARRHVHDARVACARGGRRRIAAASRRDRVEQPVTGTPPGDVLAARRAKSGRGSAQGTQGARRSGPAGASFSDRSIFSPIKTARIAQTKVRSADSTAQALLPPGFSPDTSAESVTRSVRRRRRRTRSSVPDGFCRSAQRVRRRFRRRRRARRSARSAGSRRRRGRTRRAGRIRRSGQRGLRAVAARGNQIRGLCFRASIRRRSTPRHSR